MSTSGVDAQLVNAFRSDDGMTVLRKMQSGDLPGPNVMRFFGVGLETVEDGHVVFTLEPSAKVYNMIGSVHGGVLSAVMDSALGCSVQTQLPAGVFATTMDLHARFFRPVTVETGIVRADARVIHRGRRSATAECKLVDAAGKIHASCTSTLMVLGAES